jgi:hypothetical protein
LGEKTLFAVAKGFMIPTSIFRFLRAQASPAATNVLPTPVLVPIMKMPRMEILLELQIKHAFN